jgi:hypothetical protein
LGSLDSAAFAALVRPLVAKGDWAIGLVAGGAGAQAGYA